MDPKRRNVKNATEARRRARRTPEQVEATRAYHAEYRKRNPDRMRSYKIRAQYDLSVEEYDALVARPCDLCGTTERKRHADHDHETGRVRGALCMSCNTSLGQLGDTITAVQRVLAYLKLDNVALG